MQARTSSLRGLGRALIAAFYAAPWAWLLVFCATLGIMAVNGAGLPSWLEVQSKVVAAFFVLPMLAMIPVALAAPLVVACDVAWQAAHRVSVRAWGPGLAVHLIGVALVLAVIFGDALGLWKRFVVWFS